MRRFLLVSLVAFMICSAASAASAAEKCQKLLTAQCESGELTGWSSFHEGPEVKTGDVWSLADGVLVCKGTPLGYIYTCKDYTNFVLKLQWRWPPGKKAGKGGVLLRTTGKHKIWPKCLEAQINAGAAGDFWGLDGYQLTGPAERSKSSQNPRFGKLTNVKRTQDAEKPPGQWNTYQITADGDTVTLVINGKLVNRATGCEVTPGKIVLTAEGDEIHFRNVRLTPIDK